MTKFEERDDEFVPTFKTFIKEMLDTTPVKIVILFVTALSILLLFNFSNIQKAEQYYQDRDNLGGDKFGEVKIYCVLADNPLAKKEIICSYFPFPNSLTFIADGNFTKIKGIVER